jgi:hypothetical protein
VISANTNKREEGIFIREWNRALDRLRDMDKATARLIHPVIVDDSAEGSNVYSRIRSTSFSLISSFVRSQSLVVRSDQADSIIQRVLI